MCVGNLHLFDGHNCDVEIQAYGWPLPQHFGCAVTTLSRCLVGYQDLVEWI